MAEQCDIGLDVADTAVHFIEKIVLPFEQSSFPKPREFNEPVRVVQPPALKTLGAASKCEEALEYISRKNPGSMYVDTSKLADYELSCKSRWHRRQEFLKEPPDDFGFDETTPSGKLTVGDDSDSDNESVRSVSIQNDSEPNFDGDAELGVDFFAKYNVTLSSFEKSTVSCNNNSGPPKKAKRKPHRDPVTGKFLSVDNSVKLASEEKVSTRNATENSDGHENNNEDQFTPEESNGSKKCFDHEAVDPWTLNERMSYQRDDSMCGQHFLDSHSWEEFVKLYRPYTEYWMYRYHLKTMSYKNFRQFESELPDNFRWLLEECSRVVEMPKIDLYEEVCLVESYYADILRPSNLPSFGNRYDWDTYRSKAHRNFVTRKW